MKTTMIAAVTACLLIVYSPQARGQFDFGNALRGGLRHGAQQIDGEIRGAVRGAVQDWRQGGPQHQILPYPPQHQILPYPPPQQVLPYPPMPNPRPQPILRPQPQPQPILRPQPWPPGVVNPVEPPICPTPPVTTPVITPQPQPQPQPSPDAKKPAEVELPEVEAGQTVSIEGAGFGEEPGAVFVMIGEIVLHAELVEWTDTEVEAVLPSLPLISSTPATVAVMTAEREIAERMKVQLIPASEAEEADDTKDEADEADDEGEIELPVVELGTDLALEGEEWGEAKGTAHVVIGSVTLKASVVAWSATEATIKLPSIPLSDSTVGSIQLIDAAGDLVSEFDVIFISSDELGPS